MFHHNSLEASVDYQTKRGLCVSEEKLLKIQDHKLKIITLYRGDH